MLTQGICVGYCSGYYEAWSASWRPSGEKYEAQIVIFHILLAEKIDFLGFLGKQKAIEENWKAIEESGKPLKKIKKPLKKMESC